MTGTVHLPANGLKAGPEAMIAALPMYDHPAIRTETDAFWRIVASEARAEGLGPPGSLTRPTDLWPHWQEPDLFLSQTCGLPIAAGLGNRVSVLGSFDYGLPQTPPGFYHSVALAREPLPLADLGTRVVAFSERLSQSGYGAARRALGRNDLDLETGSHAASARAVLNGEADLAFIDAVTWRLISVHEPDLAALHVVGRTPPTPGLPLITRREGPVDALRRVLARAALRAPDALGIHGFIPRDVSDYSVIPVLPGMPPAPLLNDRPADKPIP